MWHQHFNHHHLLGLAVLSMLLFAVAFVGVVARTFAQGKDSPRSAHLAQLPLADDYLEPAHSKAAQESER